MADVGGCEPMGCCHGSSNRNQEPVDVLGRQNREETPWGGDDPLKADPLVQGPAQNVTEVQKGLLNSPFRRCNPTASEGKSSPGFSISPKADHASLLEFEAI